MSGNIAIGPVQAARLLAGLRLRRGLNQIRVSMQIMRRKPVTGEPEKRTATAGKARLGWLLAALIGISMLGGAFMVSSTAVTYMQQALGSMPAAKDAGKTTGSPADRLARRTVALPHAEGSGFAMGVMQGVALETLILAVAMLLLALGTGELAKPDWDLEWLVTLPVSLLTLMAVRIAERTVLTAGLALLWPFLAIVAWHAGHSFLAALVLGLVAALPIMAVMATLRTLVDTGLRLNIGPAGLRNLTAVLGVVAALLLYLGMSAGTSPSSYILDWAPAFPDWAFWTPPGLATWVVAGSWTGSAGTALLLLVLEAGVVVAAGLAILMHQLRLGIVGAGARESGRRPAVAPRAPAGTAGPAAATSRSLLTPVQARELVLLARDRNFLVQSLVLPVLVIGAQIWLNVGSGDLLSTAWNSAAGLVAIGFFMAAYALMFSAFQTLNTEGNALWILYSVPHSLESVLRQKAMLWGLVCLAYPLAIFGIALGMDRPPLQVLGLGLVALAGVPIFAVIATALGVFASDPLAQIVQKRLRPSYMYLYMTLAGLYSYAIFASAIWQRAGAIVLTALLGLALWQKARDHLPYLLDPSASPPARVSLSDGLIAAMIFFVMQGVVTAIFAFAGQPVTGGVILIAFTIAGATAFLLMRFVFWRLKSEGVPSILGAGSGRAIAWGLAAGVAAGLVALVYVRVIQHTQLFEGARQSMTLGPNDAVWIVVLTVAAAPVFEEFIFRGLIFGGLRRTLGLAASVAASAAIFAVVHPPIAVIPVFGLGVATALVYGRTRLLIGPIAAHAAYNTMVVGYALLP